MPRRKRASSPYELFDDDDFDDDSNSSCRNGQPPIQRNAANARERARMRVLSSAFGRLKTKLPNIPPDTKLSKLDTLRLATMYIKQLRSLAEGRSSPNTDAINQMQFNDTANVYGMPNGAHSMSWPFGLHNIQNTAPRQVQFQCSPMDWNHTQELPNPVKCARLEDESVYAIPQSSHSIPPWYSPQTSNATNVAHMGNYHHNLNGLSGLSHMENNQNQHFMHGLSANSSHHQSTMSPIR